jgi:hypothetical protein
MMRVFISWSGEPSQSVARSLDGWLESILSQVDTWMSDEDIGSGQRWNEAISKSLDETHFGIVCVTRANQHAPWLIFEAGALAKSVDEGRVVPLCIDLPPADVTGPLAAFQGRSLDPAGVRRLVHDLNQATEKPLAKDRLEKILDRAWPDLEIEIAEARKKAPVEPKTPQRSKRSMVEEIVDTVRRLERTGQWFPTVTLPPPEELSGRMHSTGTMTVTGPDLSGRAYIAGYGPVPPPEEDSSKPED